MGYVLGIDLGTSSLKGLLMNKSGEVVAFAGYDYPLLHPKKGYSEQNPEEWVKACENVFKALSEKVEDFKAELEGIAISGQMHGLVTLDGEDKVVRPAILWNDTRTTKQCTEIMEGFGDRLITITKNKALEGFTLPKILWMQEEERELWAKVAHIMLPKDYLIFRLTGEFATDYSDAAGTLLLDVAAKKWSDEILVKYNIDEKILPKLYNSIDCVGKIKAEYQKEFGFEKEVKIMGGGADNACAAVGSGIVSNGIGMVSIGTSGVFLSYEDEAHSNYSGRLHLFNHGIPDAYYSMGVTLAAGHSLNWFKETFAPKESFEELLSDIDKIPAGSDGLLFAPYIVGERTPYADSKVRGSFTRIDTTHTRAHFARAVLEGITFSLRDSMELMSELTAKKFDKILSVGGGSKNKDWLQMQADIFDTEIITLTTEQGPG
ncbi:MAG: xylulokinase, partial [Catonella sp.]